MYDVSHSAKWHCDNGSFSFLAGDLGWPLALFSVELNGKPYASNRDYRIAGETFESDLTRETISVLEQGASYVAIRRDITNISGRRLAVSNIRDWHSTLPLQLGGPIASAYIYHAEGPFEWGRYRVPFAELAHRPEKTVLKDPLSPHFGATGWSPYTGILFGNTAAGAGLVEGALSQKRFYRYWTPHADGRVDSAMGMFGIDAKFLEPGETLDGELVYLEIARPLDAADPFRGYNAALRRRVTFSAEKTRHGRALIWGSWNDGPYNMVHDFIVERNADFVKAHLPSVNWVQIDDGYEVHADRIILRDPANPDTGFGQVRIAHWHFAEPENGGICARKFPRGMRATADHIRSLGLRPALWTGLHVTAGAAILKQHPEWFQDCFGYPGIQCVIPDLSIPECMAFVKEGFRRIVQDYGYEGIKLDFWTYSLIANQRPYARPFRYTAGNKTGLEYMHELLGYVRALLGDGYIETGCDISMGNPFVGAYADNFRYGIDIGDGNWKNIVYTAQCMAFLAGATQRLGYLANSDSIGVMEALSAIERRTWMTFCFISGTMIEVAGDFAAATTEVDPDYLRQGRPELAQKKFGCPPEVLADLQRITRDVENGTKVLFPDASFLDSGRPPEVWIKCDSKGRPAYVAAFNWGEEATEVKLNLPGVALRDFWTEAASPRDGASSVQLPPHGSALFTL